MGYYLRINLVKDFRNTMLQIDVYSSEKECCSIVRYWNELDWKLKLKYSLWFYNPFAYQDRLLFYSEDRLASLEKIRDIRKLLLLDIPFERFFRIIVSDI